jgi:hypothetical protein
MADPEQLAILKSGVEAWNAWRVRHPYQTVDLHGTNLRAADLSGANLSGVDLREANLRDGDLHGANLREADLTSADLRAANLRRAHLGGADLQGVNLDAANLRGADLHGANLREVELCEANLRRAHLLEANLIRADLVRANLSQANLYDANLSGARLHETILVDLDLSQVKGLESCEHVGPSTIDHRTLARSGQLPLSFLHGVGLPDLLIDFAPVLRGKPLQFHACFISYSTKDQPFAERLYSDLQGNGVRCWFAPEDIKGGKKIHEQIDDAIRLYDKLLLILSGASIASTWVEHELRRARRREVREGRRVLFPIRLIDYEALRDWECFDADAGKDLATEIREYFIPDFSAWKTDHDAYLRAFDRLLRDLRAEGAAPGC